MSYATLNNIMFNWIFYYILFSLARSLSLSFSFDSITARTVCVWIMTTSKLPFTMAIECHKQNQRGNKTALCDRKSTTNLFRCFFFACLLRCRHRCRRRHCFCCLDFNGISFFEWKSTRYYCLIHMFGTFFSLCAFFFNQSINLTK